MDNSIVKKRVREAFYEGVEESCLRAAWRKLSQIREDKNVTIRELAVKVGDRAPGMVSRWFNREIQTTYSQPSSIDWANLLVVMTELGVDWNMLSLPSQQERYGNGWKNALAWLCRNRTTNHGSEGIPLPGTDEFECLGKLFSQYDWLRLRSCPKGRQKLLWKYANQWQRSKELLDRVDRNWGNLWQECLFILDYIHWN